MVFVYVISSDVNYFNCEQVADGRVGASLSSGVDDVGQ